MTEMMAVLIYNDWFRIWTTTYINHDRKYYERKSLNAFWGKKLREGKYYEKENTMGRKVLWQGKYHEEENIKREKKLLRERRNYEEICDENGLPEWNWNKTQQRSVLF